MMDKPDVSVVLVADYGGGSETAWDDLRGTLTALAQQDFGGTVEILLCEDATVAHDIPADLVRIVPSIRLIQGPSSASYDLKNLGVQQAAADVVAILDADCVPERGWLRAAVASLERDPAIAVVSGRTVYAGRTATERALALVSRAYVDRGTAGETPYISNNNFAFRRAAFLAHPLPAGLGPFAVRLQSEAIRRSGGRLAFEPAMKVVHAFHGWAMERDVRRNTGFATIAIRQRDPDMPYAWLAHARYASIPLFAAGKLLHTWMDCCRCYRAFGLGPGELALALGAAVVSHTYEIPGMLAAFRGHGVADTSYR